MSLAEEVGFEPTARSSSSTVVRERPRRAQKAHRETTEIRSYTVSSTGSAVNTAVRKHLLVRGYKGYDGSFRSGVYGSSAFFVLAAANLLIQLSCLQLTYSSMFKNS